MNIIIEGPDNAGKSHLADFLKCNLERDLLHRSYSTDARQIAADFETEATPSNNLIIDRSVVISGHIYDSVLHRTPVVFFGDGHIKRLFTDNLVILCYPPRRYVVSTTKDEMDGVKENIHMLYQEYGKYFSRIGTKNYMVYDWTADNKEEFLNRVKERLNG